MRETLFQDCGGPKRRKNKRRPFSYSAELRFENGLPAAPCVIVDMSETGGQLEVAPEAKIADECLLLIGRQTTVRRRCRVVWRSNSRIGVSFLNEPKSLPQQLIGRAVLQSLSAKAPKKDA